jgi:hypothetical protein
MAKVPIIARAISVVLKGLRHFLFAFTGAIGLLVP